MNPAGSRFAVEVARSELHAVLKSLLKLAKGSEKAEAVMTLSDGDLVFDLPGANIGVPASGQWDGAVRFPGAFALRLARALPPDNPMHIYVERGRLHFASLSIDCTVDADVPPVIELPLDPSLADLLCVYFFHSDVEIEKAGLRPMIEEAKEKLEHVVTAAHNALYPVGVTRDELHRLVREAVDRTRSASRQRQTR